MSIKLILVKNKREFIVVRIRKDLDGKILVCIWWIYYERERWVCLNEVKSELEVFILYILLKWINDDGDYGKGFVWIL